MRRDITTAAVAIVVLTLALGVAYPLAVTGVAQVAFPGRADGDQRLIGRPRLDGKRPDPRYFQPRPSATGYSASATSFSNRGPNDLEGRAFYRAALAAYRKLNGPVARVPVDAVTTSASGVDPHISPTNARIQARRVAAARGLPLGAVTRIVADHTDGRFLGVFGEPGVNVTALNRELDR